MTVGRTNSREDADQRVDDTGIGERRGGRRSRRRSKIFVLAIPLLAATMVATSTATVEAFKPYTHVMTGQAVLDDLSDGKVTILGTDYTVNPKVVDALVDWPQFYNAGVIGPDAFPDLTFGQGVIHPTQTGLWLRHIFTSAWQAQNDASFTRTQKSQILAFAYGYLMHAAGDTWAHTLVNDFAHGAFPDVSDVLSSSQKAAIALRHLIVEGYVGDATPGFDGNDERAAAPGGDVSNDSTPGIHFPTAFEFGGTDNKSGVSRFIYETLIDPSNRNTPSTARGPLIDTILEMRAGLVSIRDFTTDPLGTLEDAVDAARASFSRTEAQFNVIKRLIDDFEDCDLLDFSCSRIAIGAQIVAEIAVLGLTASADAIGAAARLVEGALKAAGEALLLAVKELFAGYINAWIDDIDSGLRAWPELGRASMVALFDAQAKRDLQNEKCRFTGAENTIRRADCEADVGVIDVLFHETSPFITGHMMSMFGLPDFAGSAVELLQEVLGELDDILGPILGEFNPIREVFAGIEEFIKDLINSAIEEVLGVDLREFFSIGAQPASFLNATRLTFDFPLLGSAGINPFFRASDHRRLDGYLGFDAGDLVPDTPPFPGFQFRSERLADDAAFGPGDLAVFDNTVMMGKLLLLDGPGLDAVMSDLTGRPYRLYSSMGGGGVPANIMLDKMPGVPATPHIVAAGETVRSIAESYGFTPRALANANGISTVTPLAAGRQLAMPPSNAWLRSIDGDHAWRSNQRPLNNNERTGGDGNFPLWESCILRSKAFRTLFRDWENGNQQFPDLGDAPSRDPNDPRAPESSIEPISRVTLSNNPKDIGPHSTLLVGANDDFWSDRDITVLVVIRDSAGGVIGLPGRGVGEEIPVAGLTDGTLGSLADGPLTVESTPRDPCRVGTTTTQTFTLDSTPVVTTIIDENDGRLGLGAGNSLREAIAAADPGDEITFAPILNGQTIVLNGTELIVGKDLTIDATRLNNGITVSADGRSRVFTIGAGTTTELRKLTITNGDAGSGAGGGILNSGGDLTLWRVTAIDNRAGQNGGGIHSTNTGSLTIEDSWLQSNVANGRGGGISVAGEGGLTVSESAITENAAPTGGGVHLAGGPSLFVNVTIAGNTSSDDRGGGIWSEGSTALRLRHVSVVGNLGVGVESSGAGGLILENSVAANNLNGSNDADDVRGDFDAVGANLVRVHAGTVLSGPAPLTVDPALETLGSYGGSSPSMPPRVGSAVIDAAVANADTPSRDQRGGGYPRPRGDAPDLGAVESQLVSDARLFQLTTSAGQLEPAFLPDVLEYTVNAPNSTAIAAVRPISARGGSIEIRSNGGEYAPLASDSISPSIALDPGTNTIEIRVTAQNGVTQRLYTLSVVRDPFSSELSALATSTGELRPTFQPTITTYYGDVPRATTTTSITPTAVDPQATISVYGDFDVFRHTVDSGSPSPPLPLVTECGTIYTEVISGDGTASRIYSTHITRSDSPPSSDPGADETLTHELRWLSEVSNAAWNDPSISADGRFVAFSSSADNLVDGDTNNKEDVFVLDQLENEIRRVSVNADGEGGDFESKHPSISANGRFVAFESEAMNLVPGDTNGRVSRSSGKDIFVYDLDNDTIERVSLSDTGAQGNQKSITPSISGDGRYVAYASHASNIVTDFINFEVNVYIHDREAEDIADSVVGIAVPFDLLANRNSLDPDISDDGSTVVFEFSAGVSDPRTGYRYSDIYAYDLETQVVERITQGNSGKDADGNRSEAPSVSADGRFVAFQSNLATLDFSDLNRRVDVFVYDRETDRVTRVSVDSEGNEGNFESTEPAISGDGRFVAFESQANNFLDPDINGVDDIFMKDTKTGELRLLSQDTELNQGDNGSFEPTISFDGRSVAFRSRATNLGSTDTFGLFAAITGGIPERTSADLAALSLSEGGISPCLSPEVTEYESNVGFSTTAIKVKPVAARARSTIEVRVGNRAFGPLDASGVSAALPLKVGSNVIEIKVTSADRRTVKTYRVTVERSGRPALTLQTTTNGVDADIAPGPSLLVGDAITWRYVVRNTGQLRLSNIRVTDDKGVPVTCSGGNPIPALAVGASKTCIARGTAQAGWYENNGLAVGTASNGENVRATDASHYAAPVPGARIEIEQSTNGLDADTAPGARVAVGDTLSWRYVVTNTGDLRLRNIRVTDDQGVKVTCPGGNPIPALAVGASKTCTASGVARFGDYLSISTASGRDPSNNPVVDTDRSYYTGAPTGSISLVPARLMDTRPGEKTVDGQFANAGQRPAGSVTKLTVVGRGGVARNADSVVLNVTVTGTAGPGFITVFPCGSKQPLASNVNYTTGQTIPNAVIAKVGTNGQVCFFTFAATQLIVDVNGYFPATASYTSLVPARLLDTRPGEKTVDGRFSELTLRAEGSITELTVAGRAGVAPDADSVVLNVTVTGTAGPGFITVFPCGSKQPLASNVNYTTGQTIPNAVIAKVGTNGQVCFFTFAATQLIVDVNGFFPATARYNSLVPARLMDTRPGESTVDGKFGAIGLRPAGSVTKLTVAGRGGVAKNADSVALNVTATGTAGPGFITVFPCGSKQPLASNVNYTTGQTIPNAVIAKVGTNGQVCFFTFAATQLIVDVNGFSAT